MSFLVECRIFYTLTGANNPWTICTVSVVDTVRTITQVILLSSAGKVISFEWSTKVLCTDILVASTYLIKKKYNWPSLNDHLTPASDTQGGHHSWSSQFHTLDYPQGKHYHWQPPGSLYLQQVVLLASLMYCILHLLLHASRTSPQHSASGSHTENPLIQCTGHCP